MDSSEKRGVSRENTTTTNFASATMYEGDSWYNAFVPRTAKAPESNNKHKRRVSLLKQPNVSCIRPA
jgi:hypothetical protein